MKVKYLILLVLILGLVTTVLISLNLYKFFDKKTKGSSPAPEILATFNTEQIINYGDLRPREVATFSARPSETVLDLLSNTKKIETKEYSFGKMVESIEGIKSGTNSQYWLYYVNGEQSQVGADQYHLKPNDKIEWKFEKGQ